VLRRLIEDGLAHDVLLLSGGVSVGVHDFVPQTLAALGVKEVFHKVQLKPGKPVWFGVSESSGRRTLVFGLPGNPASSLVCFHLFVQPAICALSGRGFVGMEQLPARLTKEFHHRGNRSAYRPAVVRRMEAGATALPIEWLGSADLASLTAANALIEFPPRERRYAAGEVVTVHLLPAA
jgi:molybdopterin molybdotransferase